MVLDLRGDRLKDIVQILPPGTLEDSSQQAAAFASFKDLLKDVKSAHEFMSRPPCWQSEWVEGYLSSLAPNASKLKRSDPALTTLAQRWLDLEDFLWYLDDAGFDVRTAADLRGFHFSEYLAEGAPEADASGGRARLENIRDFFDYLARANKIPADTACLADLAQMLAQPEAVTRAARPDPLGGEIAVWLPDFGDDQRDEPLTYNEWWMALVLEKKFKGRWEKVRQAARKHPDADAQLALLDQLEQRLADDPEYLEYLDDERPPQPQDFRRAERWFEKEPVNNARAW
jgi:hypothetical protein